MNIDWVIPCQYGEIHDNLATIIGAGIDTWWVPQFPAPIQVVVAVRLLATAGELGEEINHTVRNVIRDPEGATLSDLSSDFKADAGEPREEWLNGIAVMTVIQFEAPQPGTYTFEHIVDGSGAQVPLHIAPGPPPRVA